MKNMWISIVFVLLGCTPSALEAPAKTPVVTAEKGLALARGLVRLTDKTLETAVLATEPGSDGYQKFVPMKDQLKAASNVLGKAEVTIKDICSAVEQVTVVGELLSCDSCVELAEFSKSYLCTGAK
jgi:hypothetical protein